jgi:hypothetical protein
MDGLEAVEVNFSQLERTTRIDSEFFKKYHIELANLLENKETEALTKFVYVSDGNHLKISDSFSDEGIPYYRGQDIHTFFIERANPIFIDEEAYNQSFMIRSHLRMGDILLSIIGTIGAVSLVSTNQPATCNYFQKLIVPLLVKDVQDEILNYLQKASNKRTKSKQLLEIAKTGVERAIKTDEATATAWINQQLEVLEITPLNPPLERWETRNLVPSPFQGEG